MKCKFCGGKGRYLNHNFVINAEHNLKGEDRFMPDHGKTKVNCTMCDGKKKI